MLRRLGDKVEQGTEPRLKTAEKQFQGSGSIQTETGSAMSQKKCQTEDSISKFLTWQAGESTQSQSESISLRLDRLSVADRVARDFYVDLESSLILRILRPGLRDLKEANSGFGLGLSPWNESM